MDEEHDRELANRRTLAEIDKLQAETHKLVAEQTKLRTEEAKMRRESYWYPALLMASALGAGLALAKFLH
jgi:hypothetical protein